MGWGSRIFGFVFLRLFFCCCFILCFWVKGLSIGSFLVDDFGKYGEVVGNKGKLVIVIIVGNWGFILLGIVWRVL